MDPETQALLDRSRKRRELLNQRFANMPEAAPRKRRTPVHENESDVRVLTVQNKEDDSPKRQCLRNAEQHIKPDTPAIQGVQSRIKDLTQTKDTQDQENVSTPVPAPRKSVSSPPLEEGSSPSSRAPLDPSFTVGRKGRFAALAQSINSWEDDLSHTSVRKEQGNLSQTSDEGEKELPLKRQAETKFPGIVTASSPKRKVEDPDVTKSSKKIPAPPVPKSMPVDTFSRSSPLRASKVQLNRSPKPFTPPSATEKSSTSDPPSVSGQGPCKTTVSDLHPTKEAVKKVDSQQLGLQEKRPQTPRSRLADELSSRPVSAKKAHFEREIMNSTPRSGFSRSTRNEKRQEQVSTPLIASVPAPAISRPLNCDPSELPISQRMSHMQEKLNNSPIARGNKAQDEPTSYSVGARMSAWENVSSSNMSSQVKKVNPAEVTAATTNQLKPPPPPPFVKQMKAKVMPHRSFKESIQEKAKEVLSRKDCQSNPAADTVKSASEKPTPCTSFETPSSPNKVVHSPNLLSKGTRAVQQQLIQSSQESHTTCSSLAAQSRSARQAELDAIHNRWKNGLLKDESSDENSSNSSEVPKKAPVGGQREEARNKARKEFADKLSEIGFGSESDKTEVKGQAARKPEAAAPLSQKPTQTSSIYALIKKKDELKEDDNVDKNGQKVRFNDSFNESDDESMRKVPRSASLRAAQANLVEPETFKKPATPQKIQESAKEVLPSSCDVTDEESISGSRTSLEIDDDDISLRGFVSEAVRRESIRTPSQRKLSSHSSLDSYDDDTQSESNDIRDGHSSHVDGYHPDNESLDDEENTPGEVGDLLDEAMDESSDNFDPNTESNKVDLRRKEEDYDPDMDPNLVVMRKKPKQPPCKKSDDYDPDMDINNVVLRRKPKPVNTESPVARMTRSHAKAMDSTDDDDEEERPYSLSAYRKSVNINQHHMEPVVRQSKYCGQHVEEEDFCSPHTRGRNHQDDRHAVQDKIKELQELVQQEQNVIMQTSNALNKCCIGNAYFEGSAEQVECNRLLLIACQKRQVYLKEIQRLKETSVVNPRGSGPQGSLTISDIRLPLKKDFVKKIGTSHDNTTHFFILLIRNGCQVICTQMLSTHDPMVRGSLDFPNLIKINAISGDFKLTVDIYGMSVSREMASKDKKRKTPKKGKGHGIAESPGGPMAVRTTSFTNVASVDLTMKCLDKTSFHLERLPHLSPLYGQIFMRLKCVMEANVEEKGFLTMFEDVSGFGAWHRRWCVLSSNKLCVWKYPDDETRKDPMTIIDLKRCVTEKVGLVPRDICARPNTFEMVTVRQPLKGEHDTLISKTHRTITTVRHQISADTKEERIMWCNKINRTLANLRMWNPDALGPSKQPSSSSRYH